MSAASAAAPGPRARPVRPQESTLLCLRPVPSLTRACQDELLHLARILDCEDGQRLFRAGACDGYEFFLLEGAVLLLDAEGEPRLLQARSAELVPIAPGRPRRCTVQVKGSARILRLPAGALARLCQLSGRACPPALLPPQDTDGPTPSRAPGGRMALDSGAGKPVAAADRIVRQGEHGETFFLLCAGQAVMTRNGDPGSAVLLGPGDSFGEESALAGLPYAGTVTMRSDGRMVRLDAAGLRRQLAQFALRELDADAARELVRQQARWLDVRPREAFMAGHIQDSISLPLPHLRYCAGDLSADSPVIVCSDERAETEAAVFRLSQMGFDVYLLAGSVSDYLGRPALATRSAPGLTAGGGKAAAGTALPDPDGYSVEEMPLDSVYELLEQRLESRYRQRLDEVVFRLEARFMRRLRDVEARLDAIGAPGAATLPTVRAVAGAPGRAPGAPATQAAPVPDTQPQSARLDT